MTSRDNARAHWAASGLTYEILTSQNLRRLRLLINEEMKAAGIIKDTLRCHQRFRTGDGWWALRCRAYYFDDREVITFNRSGFVGFAGWANEGNVRPILNAFSNWVDEMKVPA